MKNPYQKGSIKNLLWENMELYKAYSHQFKNCFQVNLSIFWENHLTGFNLVRFDEEFLHSAENQSIKDTVLLKYGETGVNLIEKLIKTQES